MKRIFCLIFVSATVLTIACKKKETDPAPVSAATEKSWNTLTGKQPLVIGHRGYAGLRPDHTLAGYLLAIEKGADFVEPDLVMTKDGFLVCRHEPMLSGTTDVSAHPEFAGLKTTKMLDGESITDWFACDFTLAQIKTLRAKQPLSDRPAIYDGIYSIPTFQEMIDLVKAETISKGRTIGIYPETKHPTFHEDLNLKITDKTLETLAAADWNSFEAPVYLQSFEVSNLKYARSKSTVKIVQLLDADDVDSTGKMVMKAPYAQPYDFVKAGRITTYNDMVTEAGLDEIKTYANGIGPWKPYIAPYFKNKRLPVTDLVARSHKKGLVVHAYTFRREPSRLLTDYNGNFQAELKFFYDLGVDGVFTDFTEEAVSARK